MKCSSCQIPNTSVEILYKVVCFTQQPKGIMEHLRALNVHGIR